LLIVDEDDKFDIVECQPKVEATELLDILDDLNRSEDMSALARRMRKCIVIERSMLSVEYISHRSICTLVLGHVFKGMCISSSSTVFHNAF
jgi:hypothetical protein